MFSSARQVAIALVALLVDIVSTAGRDTSNRATRVRRQRLVWSAGVALAVLVAPAAAVASAPPRETTAKPVAGSEVVSGAFGSYRASSSTLPAFDPMSAGGDAGLTISGTIETFRLRSGDSEELGTSYSDEQTLAVTLTNAPVEIEERGGELIYGIALTPETASVEYAIHPSAVECGASCSEWCAGKTEASGKGLPDEVERAEIIEEAAGWVANTPKIWEVGAAMRPELLPSLPACRPPARVHRHFDKPHRLPVHRSRVRIVPRRAPIR